MVRDDSHICSAGAFFVAFEVASADKRNAKRSKIVGGKNAGTKLTRVTEPGQCVVQPGQAGGWGRDRGSIRTHGQKIGNGHDVAAVRVFSPEDRQISRLAIG